VGIAGDVKPWPWPQASKWRLRSWHSKFRPSDFLIVSPTPMYM